MLSLRDVTVDIGQRQGILQNVSMDIADDKFVVITGPNGSGKSTLAKLIAGIVQPSSGSIYFDGEDITGLSITERSQRGVTFAFQQPVRFKGITVRDILGVAAGQENKDCNLCEYLAAVGLRAKDYIDRELNGSLSGGEIKRIEIAMAIARKTKLTLFDEPEAGIDIWSFNHLIGLFEQLRAATRGSIVVISHQERIFDIADEIILLDGGRIKLRGERDAVLPQLFKDCDGCSCCNGGINCE